MKHLLNEARHEIVSLRRRNEILQAKEDVLNIFANALAGNRPMSAMCEDVAWKLDKKIQELEHAEKSDTDVSSMPDRSPVNEVQRAEAVEAKPRRGGRGKAAPRRSRQSRASKS